MVLVHIWPLTTLVKLALEGATFLNATTLAPSPSTCREKTVSLDAMLLLMRSIARVDVFASTVSSTSVVDAVNALKALVST